MEKYLILKRTAFGDLIHTLPVVHTLKHSRPGCEITWVTEPQYAGFLAQYGQIDTIVPLSFRKLLKKNGGISSYFKTLRHLRKTSFDAVFDFQGRIKSAFILMNLNAREKIGFNKMNVQEGIVTHFYTRQAEPMPYRLHVIKQNLKLLEEAGITEREILFPPTALSSSDLDYVDCWLNENRISDFVAVNPFTSWLTKNWPAEHAAEFCRKCSADLGLKPVLLWGPGEKDEAREIADLAADACTLAPATSLTQLTCLLAKASAYVGGDTGPSHLAASLGVRTLFLFGPTDPLRNGPFGPAQDFLHFGLNCSKCGRGKCQGAEGYSLCMRQITPEAAFNKLEGLFGRAAGQAH